MVYFEEKIDEMKQMNENGFDRFIERYPYTFACYLKWSQSFCNGQRIKIKNVSCAVVKPNEHLFILNFKCHIFSKTKMNGILRNICVILLHIKEFVACHLLIAVNVTQISTSLLQTTKRHCKNVIYDNWNFRIFSLGLREINQPECIL